MPEADAAGQKIRIQRAAGGIKTSAAFLPDFLLEM